MASASPSPENSLFRCKRIAFHGATVAILLQNENGPCPLLAIANLLLLQKKIQIHPDMTAITFHDLSSLLAQYMLETNQTADENVLRNIDDGIKLFPRLLTGLDVNVKFNAVDAFEFSEDMLLFDIMHIRLVHGWIIDPADTRVSSIVANCSYNQLVEMIIESQSLPAIERPSKPTIESHSNAAIERPSMPMIESNRNPIIETQLRPTFEGQSHSTCDSQSQPTIESQSHSTSDSQSHPTIESQLQPTVEGQLHPTIDSQEHQIVGNQLQSTVASQLQPIVESQSQPAMEVQSHLIVEGQLHRNGECPSHSTTASESRPTSVESLESTLNSSRQVSATPSSSIVGNSEETLKESKAEVEGEAIPLACGDVEEEAALAAALALSLKESNIPPSVPPSPPSSEESLTYRGHVASEWLESSATQLTYFGLACLYDKISDGELCVLFRNNHFGTLTKYEGELYHLATDIGYINEPLVVWERLNQIDGDSELCGADFEKVDLAAHDAAEFAHNEAAIASAATTSGVNMDSHAHVDHSHAYLGDQVYPGAVAYTSDIPHSIHSLDLGPTAGDDSSADLALAIALQQEEQERADLGEAMRLAEVERARRARTHHQSSAPRPRPRPREDGRGSGSGCLMQ